MSEYRKELKYMLADSDYEILKNTLPFIMKLDENCESGHYTISSIYLDNYNQTSYKQVKNGISTRWKYRIRFYNYDDGYIKLEKKYKENNLTKKTAVRISRERFEDILYNRLKIRKENSPLLNEVAIKMKTELLRPIILIEYDRVPYIYKLGNVRVTLDGKIRCSNKFEQAFCSEKNMMYLPETILEVKYDEFIPDFIRYKLELNHLEQTSFSKYSNCMDLLNFRRK